MRRTGLLMLAGVGSVALAAGIAIYFLAAGPPARLDTAAVIPPDAAYVVRMEDAGAWLDRARTQPWWDDASRFFESSALEGTIGAGRKAVEELSKRVGTDLDLEDARRLLGDEVTFAVLPASGRGVDWVVSSRVDVAGLAADLLSGGTDWRDLRDELFRRVELADLSIETREVDGYVSAIATRDGASVHIVMIDDLLVVGSSAGTIDAAVSLAADGGAGSLDESVRWRGEIARLPKDATATDFLDLTVVRKHAADLAVAIDGVEAESLEAWLAPLKADAVARAVQSPDGDVYRATWGYSRSFAELFEDGSSPPMVAAIPGDAHVALAVQDLGGMWDALRQSAAWRHLENSWAVEELGKKVMDSAAERSGSKITDYGLDSDFVVKLMTHAIAEHLTHVVRAEAAASAKFDFDEFSDSEGVAAIRLGIDGALLYHAAVAQAGSEAAQSRDVDGRTLVSTRSVTLVRVGDALVIASGDEVAEAAAARLAAGGDATSAALDGTRPDARFRMGVDVEGLIDAALATPNADEAIGQSGLVYGGHVARITTDADVDDAFTVARFGLALHYRPGEGETVRLFAGADEQAVEPMLAALPGGGIAARAGVADIGRFVASFRDILPIEEDDWSRAMTEGSEHLGVDIEGELLPNLGPAFAWSFRPSGPRSGGQPPIPGLAVACDVRDRDIVDRAVQGLVSFLEREMRDDEAFEGTRFSRIDTEVGHVRRMEFGPGMGAPPSVGPVIGWVDDRLVIASHMSHWEAFADVARGRVAGSAQGPEIEELRTAGLAIGGIGTGYLNWDLLLDQIAVYSPEMAESLPTDVPVPEWNENMTDEDWQHSIEAYHAANQAAADGREGDVRAGIDSFRVMRVLGSTDTLDGDTMRSELVITMIR